MCVQAAAEAHRCRSGRGRILQKSCKLGKLERERGSHHLKPNERRKTRCFGMKADGKMVVKVTYIMTVEVALKRSRGC